MVSRKRVWGDPLKMKNSSRIVRSPPSSGVNGNIKTARNQIVVPGGLYSMLLAELAAYCWQLEFHFKIFCASKVLSQLFSSSVSRGILHGKIPSLSVPKCAFAFCVHCGAVIDFVQVLNHYALSMKCILFTSKPQSAGSVFYLSAVVDLMIPLVFTVQISPLLSLKSLCPGPRSEC